MGPSLYHDDDDTATRTDDYDDDDTHAQRRADSPQECTPTPTLALLLVFLSSGSHVDRATIQLNTRRVMKRAPPYAERGGRRGCVDATSERHV